MFDEEGHDVTPRPLLQADPGAAQARSCRFYMEEVSAAPGSVSEQTAASGSLTVPFSRYTVLPGTVPGTVPGTGPVSLVCGTVPEPEPEPHDVQLHCSKRYLNQFYLNREVNVVVNLFSGQFWEAAEFPASPPSSR